MEPYKVIFNIRRDVDHSERGLVVEILDTSACMSDNKGISRHCHMQLATQ